MTVEMTPEQIRNKNRSLETMLSRTRREREQAIRIATDAVNSVKEMKNGNVKEAAEALGLALKRTEELLAAVGKIGDGKEAPVAEEVIKVKTKKKAAAKTEQVDKPAAEKKPIEKKEKEVTDGHWIDEWL